jgi:hypothetical protein
LVFEPFGTLMAGDGHHDGIPSPSTAPPGWISASDPHGEKAGRVRLFSQERMFCVPIS